ncbi:hypothetical protein M2408_001851 [Sphingobacterium sp. BIGb0165]|nr:hypothetical protein [Sphingobacterium sp. BIGb0165]
MIRSTGYVKKIVSNILTQPILCRIIGVLMVLFNSLITFNDIHTLYQYHFCKSCYSYEMELESILYFRITIGTINILLGMALITLKIRYWLLVLIIYILIFNISFELEKIIRRIEIGDPQESSRAGDNTQLVSDYVIVFGGRSLPISQHEISIRMKPSNVLKIYRKIDRNIKYAASSREKSGTKYSANFTINGFIFVWKSSQGLSLFPIIYPTMDKHIKTKKLPSN